MKTGLRHYRLFQWRTNGALKLCAITFGALVKREWRNGTPSPFLLWRANGAMARFA